MRVVRGDVVMVDWQYSDRTGSKVRPAVVVQIDGLNRQIHDTLLVAISRTARGGYATEVPLDPTAEPASGLKRRSVASCNNIDTLDQFPIQRIIGKLSPVAMQQVELRLKYALGLP
jgi:mRNA interferase MazF